MRRPVPPRPTPRSANTAEHQARLAWRLTPRDRWIVRMLHEHRVLTSTQITALAFPSYRSGAQRLRELYLWSLVDRFQPFATLGTAPMHYVLAGAGAAVLAAEEGLDVKELGYRHNRAFGIAHSLRLAHLVGVNEWFTALVAAAHHTNAAHHASAAHHTGAADHRKPREEGRHHAAVTAWWSEARCARHFGDLVKPDAYGRWSTHGEQVEFFLEFDTGTEAMSRLAGKLTGYAALAAATGITTPLLFWLPTARREASARIHLHRAWRTLDAPDTVPVATAAAGLLNPDSPHPSPADSVWLPLHHTSGATSRLPLHHLPSAWSHLPHPAPATRPLDDDLDGDGHDGGGPSSGSGSGELRPRDPGQIAAPHPMPPDGAQRTSRPPTSRTRG